MKKSKAVSRGQALEVTSRVGTQTKWGELGGDILQKEVIGLSPEEFGRRFTAFLKNGAKLCLGLMIDHDAPPFIPEGLLLHVQENLHPKRAKGCSFFDLSKSSLFFPTTKVVCWGVEFSDAIRDKRVAGANVLDFFLEHKDLIPETWKGKRIGFWGTFYKDMYSYAHIRYLEWNDGALKIGDRFFGDWVSRHRRVGDSFHQSEPALILPA